MATSMEARVRAVISGPVQQCGADLEGVALQNLGKRRLLRVTVDTDAGVSLDEVAEITTAVSQALDATEVMGERSYTLEVGSPGVDRPLTEPRQWRRNMGRLVRIRLADREPFVARIAEVADDRATVSLQDGSGRRAVPFADVRSAVIQVELSRAGGQ